MTRLRSIVAPPQERAQERAAGRRRSSPGETAPPATRPAADDGREPAAVQLRRRRTTSAASAGSTDVGVGEVADRRQRAARAGGRPAASRRSSPCAGRRSATSRSRRPGRAGGPRHATSSSSLRSNRSWRPRQIPNTCAPAVRRIADRRGEAAPLERCHGRTRCADAGHEHAIRAATRLGVVRHRDVGSRRSRPCAGCAGCPRRSRRRTRGHRLPFVLGTAPARRGSGSQAARSASASALNAASSRWWSSAPVPVRWMADAAAGGRALSKKWGTREAGSAPTRSPAKGRSIARDAAAAQVDGGVDGRLVERGARVAEAADPGPLAEGAVERLAEDDGDVLDGVVLVDPQVARAGQVEVDQRVRRERGRACGRACRSPSRRPTRPHPSSATRQRMSVSVVRRSTVADPRRRLRCLGLAPARPPRAPRAGGRRRTGSPG